MDEAGSNDIGGGRSDRRVKYLEKEVAGHIAVQTKERGRNMRTTYVVKTTVVVLAALTTVVLGAKGYAKALSTQDALSIAALFISAAVSAISAWEALAQPGWNWVRARMKRGALLQIKDDLEFRLRERDPLTDVEIRDLYVRLKEILQSDNDSWAASRATAISGASARR